MNGYPVLEDHALARPLEHVFDGVQLPAGVRGGLGEPVVRGPGLLRRLGPGYVLLAEDPCQRDPGRDPPPGDAILSGTRIGP